VTNDDKPIFAKLLSATMQTYDRQMTPDMLTIWFGSLQRFSIEQLRAALSEHMQDPDSGRFAPRPADMIGRVRNVPNMQHKALEYAPQPAPPHAMEKIKAFVGRQQRGPWWTPERVRNQAQVDHIIRQANHFGQDSSAGKFLQDCIRAGVIADGNILTQKREAA
jgi:hypothetical protein